MFQRRGRGLWYQQSLFGVCWFICILVFIVLVQLRVPLTVWAQPPSSSNSNQLSLPTPQVHPLPPVLAQWQDLGNHGDYFSEIQPTPVGYLVWSAFPIKVFVEPVDPSSHGDRAQVWLEAVQQAIQEWNVYLPLEWVAASETADIAIWRSAPPIQGWDRSSNSPDRTAQSETPPRLPRIRSAETRYQVFVDERSAELPKLSHRFTIQLTPNQTAEYIKATARHELGHALGIWGHSPSETDALYFSQVRHPPGISVRDVNTLKRIYEQPTQIGWPLPRDMS